MSHTHIPSVGLRGFWGKPNAPLNWCEEDYQESHFVAEFWNTLSNLAYVLVSISALRRAKRYRLGTKYYFFGCLLLFLGIASAFFHATLWWWGQKADEVVETAALVSLLYMHSKLSVWVMLAHIMMSAMLIIVISMIFCEVHLLFVALGISYRHFFLNNKTSAVVARHVWRIIVISISAFSLWALDLFGCNMVIKKLPFNPQLHAMWHLLTAVAFHEIGTLDAQRLVELRGDKANLYLRYGVSHLDVRYTTKCS